MARAERTVKGDFQTIVKTLHDAVMNGSMSASFEEESVLSGEGYECVVRVYERYSWFGSNQVKVIRTRPERRLLRALRLILIAIPLGVLLLRLSPQSIAKCALSGCEAIASG